MSEDNRVPHSDDGQKVGYGNPPLSGRFKEKVSGNPRARPRGTRSIAKMLNDALMKKVRVKENGKGRWVTMLELILGRLIMDAAKGLTGSTRLLLALLERYGNTSDTKIDIDGLLAEDRAILNRYFADQQPLPGDPDDERFVT